MNIPYASPLAFSVVNGSSAATHINELYTVLNGCQWVMTNVAGSATGSFSSATLPGNNTTVTIGSVVYRFVNTLSAANDVQIGATVADCIDNLSAAINDVSGEGTKYGAGTTANPDVTSTFSGSTITVTNITTGAVSVSLADTISNFGFTTANTAGGGFVALTRADHPCGYQLRLYVYLSGDSTPVVRYRASSLDSSRNIDRQFVTMASGRTFMARATPYDLHVILLGSSTNYFYCGALWNPIEWSPPIIDSITTGATTTIEQTAHGLSTGQSVTLNGITGSASWEGQTGRSYAITVVDADNYTIPVDSTSFGTPVLLGTAGTSANITISLVVFSTTSGTSIRTQTYCDVSGTPGWSHLNGSAAGFSTAYMTALVSSALGTPTKIAESFYYVYQPALVSASSPVNGIIGCLWNAVFYSAPGAVETDLDQIPLDSRRFFNLKIGDPSPIAPRGAVFLEVPAAP